LATGVILNMSLMTSRTGRSLWENVSYQLVGAQSTGMSEGVLVHFSESMVTNDTSIVYSVPSLPGLFKLSHSLYTMDRLG
jgi:hypothetical protein